MQLLNKDGYGIPESEILDIIEEVRTKVMHKKKVESLSGQCATTSLLLFYILKEVYDYEQVEMVSGWFDNLPDGNHTWIIAGGIVIDCTSDQFGHPYGIISEEQYQQYYEPLNFIPCELWKPWIGHAKELFAA